MKSAFLLLGMLIATDDAIVTPANPVSPSDRIVVGDAFEAPLPADIQMIEPSFGGFADDGTCCNDCNNCGCGYIKYDLCHPPTDMMPHLPYCATPKTYYYFRPYHWSHVLQHQADSVNWGVDPSNPYSNKLFDDVYAEIEEEIQGASTEE